MLLQSADRRREARPDFSLPRQIPAGLDDLAGPAAGRRRPVAPRREGRRQRRHRRSARALHRHRDVAERADRRRHRDDRDVHQRTEAQPHRQSRTGRHRRRLRISLRGSRTDRWRRSRPPATRAVTRRSTRSKSTASTPRPHGICTICIGFNSSITVTKGGMRGWRSVHITDGDHPYMKHWWVPGLQIGYEHTFIHQFADFLQAVGEGKVRRRRSVTVWRPTTSPTPCSSRLRADKWEQVSTRNRPWGRRGETKLRMTMKNMILVAVLVAAGVTVSSQQPPAAAPAQDRGRDVGAARRPAALNRWSWTTARDSSRFSMARR